MREADERGKIFILEAAEAVELLANQFSTACIGLVAGLICFACEKSLQIFRLFLASPSL
jgi:hypothetical protein